MKKVLIFVAGAALLFASCAKNEVVSNVGANEEIPIGFSNYTPRANTKADASLVNTGALPAGSKIGVYGYSTATDNLVSNFTTTPEFMTNASVTYASTSATATATDPKRYWPKTITNLLSFYAFYPRESAKITAKPTASTAGMGTFTFTQGETVEAMEDFMISDVANDQYYWATGEAENASGVKATNGVVPLKFNHMLAKVNFKFKTLSDYSPVTITVKSAKISKDVLKTVTITPAYTAGAAGSLGTTAFTYVSNTAHTADIVIPFDAAGLALNNTTAQLNNGTATTQTDFLFVPQSISDDVTVTIDYIINQNGTETANTVTVQLNTVKDGSSNPITEWHINDFVTYTFVIGLKEILFTADVNNWNPIEAAGYTIQ